MLGAYFSRKDTLDVFWSYVQRIDFGGADIVIALRQLFDTFKPGGEGQVVTRILEYFAESYFMQWKARGRAAEPETAYSNADSVLQVAVSLIMLNTGLHVATKKMGKRCPGAAMTLEEYIKNTRQLVSATEVPDEVLQRYYDDVAKKEISMTPMPRVPFSELPVQPDVEGWLIAVLSPQTQIRYWAVLALQRLYLFTDTSGEADPHDAIDLKDVTIGAVSETKAGAKRYAADLTDGNREWFRRRKRGKLRSDSAEELLAAGTRALEIAQRPNSTPSILQKSCKQPRARLALVAESKDLMEKWLHLISSGS
jgi:hypothetical protein